MAAANSTSDSKRINLVSMGQTPIQQSWVITTHEGHHLKIDGVGELAGFIHQKANQVEALMACVTNVNEIENAEAVLPMVYDLAYQLCEASSFLTAFITSTDKEVAHG